MQEEAEGPPIQSKILIKTVNKPPIFYYHPCTRTPAISINPHSPTPYQPQDLVENQAEARYDEFLIEVR